MLAIAVAVCPAQQLDDRAAVRKQLQFGKLDEAERLVQPGVGRCEPWALAMEGEIRFRRADFEGAAAAYNAAIQRDDHLARAYWGLGRIELIQFHRSNARTLMARAYGLDPRDPDIIRSYAEFATDPRSRETLLRNVVALTRNDDSPAAAAALNQLAMERRLQGNPRGRVATGYRDYAIPLKPYQPHGMLPAGLLAPVEINGGKPLWLVLDSGGTGIMIGAKAARKLGLEMFSETRISGVGGSVVGGAVTVAKSVQVGDLVLENCAVDVTPESLAQGADGVIGMDVFEAFRIRLDSKARLLHLVPFETMPTEDSHPNRWISFDRSAEASPPTQAYGFRHFLLLKARVQGGKTGLFLVDTGSAVTSLAKGVASPTMGIPADMALSGAGGAVSGVFRISPIVVEVAGRVVGDGDPVVMDLDEISRRQGVQISGILGYSVLRKSTVTFNYRDGLVELGDGR